MFSKNHVYPPKELKNTHFLISPNKKVSSLFEHCVQTKRFMVLISSAMNFKYKNESNGAKIFDF